MSDPDTTSAAVVMNRGRWGNQVAEKAAEVVIERASQLSPSTRSAVLEAVAEPDAGPSDAV
jgi:hypothetical protein